MAFLKPTLLLLLALSTQAIALPADQTNQTKGPVIGHHLPTSSVSAPTKTEPTTQLDHADLTSTEAEVHGSTTKATERPSVLPTSDLTPDPMNELMIGMPTGTCYYRFQLSGKRDHYFVRGRNWNITVDQLEAAVKKVVYEKPKWGESDVHGNYGPKKNNPDDLITFRFKEEYGQDSVHEFDAEVSCSFLFFSLPFLSFPCLSLPFLPRHGTPRSDN